MKGRMDVRSALYLAAGALLAPAVLIGPLLGGLADTLAAFPGTMALPLLAIAVLPTIGVNRPGPRPARFAVSSQSFRTRTLLPPAALALVSAVALAYRLGNALVPWLRSDNVPGPDPLAFVIFAAGCCLLLALVVGRAFVTLTPEGVTWRPWLFRQQWAWDELAAGERRMWVRLRSGKPWFTGYLDTDPSFVTDAIRWYVEHPDDRAAIGTEAEHARLVMALGVAPGTSDRTHGAAS